MTSPPPASDNLTLFEISRQLLAELQVTNKILANIQHQAVDQNDRLSELLGLVNGFTSGGASFSAYQVDPFTQAYLAVMGPLLARRIDIDDASMSLPEMMKGATLLARQLVEELAAYRNERASLDYLEEQAELLHDPWVKNQPEPSPESP